MDDKLAWIVYSFGDGHASMSVHGVYDNHDLALKALYSLLADNLRSGWKAVSMPFKLNSPISITTAPAGAI